MISQQKVIGKLEESVGSKCCNNPRVAVKSGFNVCLNCGVVHEKIFVNTPSRGKTLKERVRKRSNEYLTSCYGPRTFIKGSLDYNGKLISPVNRILYNRLGKIQNSLTSSLEINLHRVLPRFKKLVEKLEIPKFVEDQAFKMYKIAVKMKLSKNIGNDSFLSASVFLALRFNKIAIPTAEILEVLQVSEKKFFLGYKKLVMRVLPRLNLKPRVLSPRNFVDRFYSDLHLSIKCRNIALQLFDKAKSKGFITSGKDPKAIAAALLYLSAREVNERQRKKDICKEAKICNPTLNNRIKELTPYVSAIVS